ncbi:cupin domain-containing protein [Deinococcus pimensis]|uniref:cupin domain-containing protein n=1 Tax=Deinococcus pimensis TaxID=309888 RepID=UPI0004B72404|nr:cupin domain-containing protein [Deinococcus pimensis]
MYQVQAGDTLENPVTGELVSIIEAPSDTNGRRLIVEGVIRPGGAVAGAHVHPDIDETFTVLRGRIGLRLGHRKLIAPLGERVRCPAGTVHDWWNAGDEDAVVRVEITPGDRFLQMAANLFGLAQDGRTNAKGMPNFLQLVVFAQEFQDVLTFVEGPPPAVLKAVTAVVAPVARLLGYRGSYPRYVHQPRLTRAATPSSVTART